MPEMYQKFITNYPEYKDICPNYIGRIAYINSLRDGIEISDHNQNMFAKIGDKLVCAEYRISLLPFDSKLAKVELDINDKMTVKITSSDMVDENTLFKD